LQFFDQPDLSGGNVYRSHDKQISGSRKDSAAMHDEIDARRASINCLVEESRTPWMQQPLD
jgi:hypothetical protein